MDDDLAADDRDLGEWHEPADRGCLVLSEEDVRIAAGDRAAGICELKEDRTADRSGRVVRILDDPYGRGFAPDRVEAVEAPARLNYAEIRPVCADEKRPGRVLPARAAANVDLDVNRGGSLEAEPVELGDDEVRGRYGRYRPADIVGAHGVAE